MKNQTIMLIDDDPDDNFFAQRAIEDFDPGATVIEMTSPLKAIEYIKAHTLPKANIIFLDVYMPIMTGWEFLEQYCELDESLRSEIMIIMLSISGDPRHYERAQTWDCITDYVIKPLTETKLTEISNKHRRSE